MYKIKETINVKINKKKASEEIGISREYLTQIVNGKTTCTKKTAYCITKFLNGNAEIKDFFVREEN